MNFKLFLQMLAMLLVLESRQQNCGFGQNMRGRGRGDGRCCGGRGEAATEWRSGFLTWNRGNSVSVVVVL